MGPIFGLDQISHSGNPWIAVSNEGLRDMAALISHDFSPSATRIQRSTATSLLSCPLNCQSVGYKEAPTLNSKAA